MLPWRVDGMSRWKPYIMRSSSTLRLSFTLQNTLRWSGRDDFWFGNQLRIVPLRAWYAASSLDVFKALANVSFHESMQMFTAWKLIMFVLCREVR